MESLIRISLKQGVMGATERQKNTVAALGLRYRLASRVLKDSPSVRGMVNSVAHLVSWEKTDGKEKPAHPFAAVPEYELGPVPEKKEPAKKAKKAPAVKAVDEGHGEMKDGLSKKEAKPHAKASPAHKKPTGKSAPAAAKKPGGKTTKKAK